MEKKQLLNKIEQLLEMADRMKNAYLWQPPTNAGGRRLYEKNHSISPIEWEEGGHNYSAELVVSCSCAIFMYIKNITGTGKR